MPLPYALSRRQAEVLVSDDDVLDAICADEPIHLAASIQPHGALLGLSCEAAPRVLWASANYAAYLGTDRLESPAASLLGEAYLEGILRRKDIGELQGESPWETTISVPGAPGARLEAVGHAYDGLIIVELEQLLANDEADALIAGRRLQRCVARLRASESGLQALAQVAAEGVRALTGYERVLVYRFDADWHGMAIAEAKAPDWEQSLNGLHFPAADIPAQARALYRRSLMRWVASRDVTPVSVEKMAPGAPRVPGPDIIDLSFARLRSLSPVHLQYHRNMGVDGSMSLSILSNGELWGLMVCHHRRPHRLSPGQRSAAGSLVDAFALRVDAAERTDTRQQRRADAQRMAALLSHAVETEDVERAVTAGSVTIAHLFNATGAASVQAGSIVTLGVTPPPADMLALVGWLRGRRETEVYATDRLHECYPPFARHAAIASGLLAVFLSSDRADMLLWLRPEEPQLVSWGGDPRKPATQDHILPRQSFERWVETRHGQAAPWLEWELEMAASLRQSISEVMVRHLRRLASLNEQLRQAQKMEAVGQLTGGLAHDFNNLLTGITGSLEMMKTRLDQGRAEDVARYIGIAQGAADRAAALTHRLLAFARRQNLEPQLLDANKLVVGLDDLIRQTVGPNIQLRTVLAEQLWPTLCDPNQLENALLNLCINARDAMPEGGRLTIETANAALGDRRAAALDDLPTGHYVSLRVSDSGTGMSPDVIARAFDPFFTTKPYGAGSGLGLSMIYGFAKQSGGNVRIYSQAGHGTTVKLYLPCEIVSRPAADEAPLQPASLHGPHVGTVLVVDDEPHLLMLVTEMLSDLGYTVMSTGSAAAALEIIRDTQIDLLVTDAGLPGDIDGAALAASARALRADLKVLFITGYAEATVFGDRVQQDWERVLSKPFAVETLARTASELLRT